MQFEFDPAKSALNKGKHGIDFVEAQAIWDDDRRVEYDARQVPEERFAVIGYADGKLWTGIFTVRTDAIRIISVRRARSIEVRLYETRND